MTFIGKKFQLIREQTGLSQRRFAKEIGTDPATISRVESGERQPSKAMLVSVAKRYGISFDELLKNDDFSSSIVSTSLGAPGNKTMKTIVAESSPPYDNASGYAGLRGNAIILKAAHDEAIYKTNLFRIVSDDGLWAAMAIRDGAVFEVLRGYLLRHGDRELTQWAEAARVINYCRAAGVLAVDEGVGLEEEKA